MTLVVLTQIDPDFKFTRGETELYRVVDYQDFLAEGKAEPDETFESATDFEADDDVLFFWSSGTTGLPKGASYSYDQMARMILHEQSVFVDNTVDTRTVLMTTNFFHAGGFTFALVTGVKNCHTLVLFASKEESAVITPEDFFRAAHEYRPSVMKVGSHHAIKLGYSKPEVKDYDLTGVQYSNNTCYGN